jgi:cell wall-associated NlpC family hydrolase
MEKNYSALIGVPYEKRDCYGIVIDFYKEVLGVELKNYYTEIPETSMQSQNLIYSSMGDFKKVDIPQFGDIIVIKLKRVESHIGVYVGEDKMLHTLKNIGCHIENISKYRRMISGYFRMPQ